MGRTIRFNNAANSFVQGLSVNNREVVLFMLGGNDEVFLNRSDDFGGRNQVDAGLGADTVRSLDEDGNFILLGGGNDLYIGEGFGSFSTERADTVRGGAGNDTMLVTTAKSLYLGDDGADRFFSSGQRNDFVGGAGRDSISYELREIEDGGVRIDLASGVVNTGNINTESLRSIENATGSLSSDTIFGNRSANRITGAGGDDFLTGRGGADVFVWRTLAEGAFDSESGDVILDFNRAQGDRIDLSGIDAVAGGANNAFSFRGAADFTGRAGQLRLGDRENIGDINGDGVADFVTVLSGDVNGDGAADFGIRLLNVASISAADLVL